MMKGFLKTLMIAAAAASLAVAQGPRPNQGTGNQNQTGSGSQNQTGNNNQKQSWDVFNHASGGLVEVIVQLKKGYGIGALNQVLQFQDPGDQQQEQIENQHGQDKHNFNVIGAFHLRVPSWAIPMIANLPGVAYITPVRPVQKSLDITDVTVAANIAWNYGWTGAGVGVAVIDSGIYSQADDFQTNGHSRVVYSESFIAGADASDHYGHGTHVAGIVGSSGNDSTGNGFSRTFKGVAPGVNLINLRVLDANGMGYDSDVIAAIQRAIQLKNAYNIRVINLSLGRPIYESYTLDPLCQAVEAAWQAGIVVVTAAGNAGRSNTYGNQGYGTIIAPGNDPYVITVGAMNTKGTTWRWDDVVASYSSKGPTLIDHVVKPDLVAPGNNIVSVMAPNSTIPNTYPQTLVPNNYYETGQPSGNSGNYLKLSGTSMATPVVAGAAALLIQQNPSLTPDQVKARLMKTANKMLPLFSSALDMWTLFSFSNQSDIFTVGAGYLDINGALNNHDFVAFSALSPTAYLNPVTGHVTIHRGGHGVWGTDDMTVWGDSLVWGNAVLAGVDLLNFSITWGDTVFGLDDMTVWGDAMVTMAPPQALSANDSDQ
jgi:serine protease AprX